MPRVAAQRRERSPAQLANDERLRTRAIEKKAKNNPAVIRGTIESQEQQIGQDGVREFNKDNELPQIKTDSAIEIAGAKRKKGGPRGRKWMDDMIFANETVTVIIHESTDKTANPFPEVWVNGRVQRFVRGHEQQVRRCFVEKLARLKLTTYDNVKTKDVDGEDVYRYPSHTGLVYPFVIINPTDKDRKWLKEIEAEA